MQRSARIMAHLGRSPKDDLTLTRNLEAELALHVFVLPPVLGHLDLARLIEFEASHVVLFEWQFSCGFDGGESSAHEIDRAVAYDFIDPAFLGCEIGGFSITEILYELRLRPCIFDP